MTGENFISNEDDLSGDVLISKEDQEETPYCYIFISLFIQGIGLGFTILVLSLGFMTMGLFIMIPIEQWIETYNIIIQILVEIPLVVIFILVLPIMFYTVGFINRFGVERISKTKLPKNRKWTILSGSIVYVIGWILIRNIFGFTMEVDHPVSYWIGVAGYAITSVIEWFCIFLVGGIGYLVGMKLSLFRLEKQNEISAPS